MSKKIKILIIEDDKFLLKLYSDKLIREGFEVESSLTGEEGFNKINNLKPDLIILDLMLPLKNGFEILSDIKINPKIKKIPVVILSNLGQESDIKKGLELGAADYLLKTDVMIKDMVTIVKKNLVKKSVKTRKPVKRK